jgi:hypothetical protein
MNMMGVWYRVLSDSSNFLLFMNTDFLMNYVWASSMHYITERNNALIEPPFVAHHPKITHFQNSHSSIDMLTSTASGDYGRNLRRVP